MREINEKGLAIVKASEGLCLTPYVCPGGYLTIGYGTRIEPGEYTEITMEQAEELLVNHVRKVELQLAVACEHIPLTDNQWSALVSFVYNIGIGQFMKSTLFKCLQMEEYLLAANQFGRWTYAKGVKLNGLIVRRAKERSLFLEEY